MIFNEENVLLVLTYLLPGFIIIKIINTELLLDNRSTANDIYKYLLYSFINLFVYSLIDGAYLKLREYPMIYNELAIMIIRNLFFPILIGVFLSTSMKKSQMYKEINLWYYINRLFTLLELNRKSQIDDAWDWVFYNLYLDRESGTEIVIVLNDKTEICGVFGKKSFASYNKAGNRCIFIEKEIFNSPISDEDIRGRFISEKDIQSIKIPSEHITVEK